MYFYSKFILQANQGTDTWRHFFFGWGGSVGGGEEGRVDVPVHGGKLRPCSLGTNDVFNL